MAAAKIILVFFVTIVVLSNIPLWIAAFSSTQETKRSKAGTQLEKKL
jgi:hypothetical protein